MQGTKYLYVVYDMFYMSCAVAYEQCCHTRNQD